MCGIAGFVLKNDRATEDNSQWLRSMGSAIRHRGPDAFGQYVEHRLGLCVQQLRIVDHDHGNQPIANEDGSCVVGLNGEIYNYKDIKEYLRSKGHTLKTDTDTEVLVHLYEEDGVAMLDRLRGMFAFAIWDRNKGQLFLARDRSGVKPLYYTSVSDGFYFGSEIKAILACPKPSQAMMMNHTAFLHIFWFAFTLDNETCFKNIHKVRPGHYMIVEASGSFREQEYWDLPYVHGACDMIHDFDTAVGLVRQKIEESIQLRVPDDWEIGAFLSGGIDSSATAVLAAKKSFGTFHTYSLGFEQKDLDERYYSNLISRQLRSDHHVIVADQFLMPVLPQVTWHLEMPQLYTISAALKVLGEKAHEKIRVLITGEGSDEVLAGYPAFLIDQMFQEVQSGSEEYARDFFKKLFPQQTDPLLLFQSFKQLKDSAIQHFGICPHRFMEWEHMWQVTSQVFSPDFLALADQEVHKEILSSYLKKVSHCDRLSQVIYLEHKTRLANWALTNMGDSVSMSNSIEQRTPFVDHELIELCCRIPSEFKLRGMTEKAVLKEAMRPYLPAEIVDRKKQAFLAPLGNFKDQMSLLQTHVAREKGFFNPTTVEENVYFLDQGGAAADPMQQFLRGLMVTFVITTHSFHDQFFAAPHGVVAGAQG